jgi:hypothetical protein
MQIWIEEYEGIPAGRQRLFCQGREVARRSIVVDLFVEQGKQMHHKVVDVVTEPPLTQVLLSADLGGERASDDCHRHDSLSLGLVVHLTCTSNAR